MTTRTETLRRLFAPHFSMFGPKHRAALEELVELARVGERTLAMLGPAKRRRRPVRPPTLRETIRAVLREAARPLRRAEIELAVKARGYRSSASNFTHSVGSALVEMQVELRRVSPGVYTLA